jgi:serine/threonine-protein kinase
VPRCSTCHSEYAQGERFCPIDGGAIVDEGVSDPLIGRKLDGRYLVKRLIGKGGMGAVYEADHVGLDKRVAVKVILDRYTEDREAVSRFHREARSASRIGHDNIVAVTDIAEVDGRHFIVMEYLHGHDLAAELRESGPMPPRRAIDIVGQVLAGLAAAHEAQVVHRDMKPENVFLCDDRGRTDFVKIMDFGISKFISAHDTNMRLTGTGKVVGTPLYMAPEQARGDDSLDHRVDIYAVGIMLFELLAGRPPFVASSYLGVLTQHLHERPPSLTSVRADIPPDLVEAVERALEKNPADRFASAREFAAAIGNSRQLAAMPAPRPGATGPISGPVPVLSTSGPRYAPTVAASQMGRAVRARRVLVALAVAALLAAGAVIAGLAMGGGGDPGPTTAAAAAIDAAIAPPGPDAAIPIASPLRASLEIASEPPGAIAYVDGEKIGETPARIESIDPGDVVVRIEHDGYKVLEAKKQIRDGYSETFFGALARESSRRRGTVRRGGDRKGDAIRVTAKPEREPDTESPPEPERDKPPLVPDRKPEGKPNPFVQ